MVHIVKSLVINFRDVNVWCNNKKLKWDKKKFWNSLYFLSITLLCRRVLQFGGDKMVELGCVGLDILSENIFVAVKFQNSWICLLNTWLGWVGQIIHIYFTISRNSEIYFIFISITLLCRHVLQFGGDKMVELGWVGQTFWEHFRCG